MRLELIDRQVLADMDVRLNEELNEMLGDEECCLWPEAIQEVQREFSAIRRIRLVVDEQAVEIERLRALLGDKYVAPVACSGEVKITVPSEL